MSKGAELLQYQERLAGLRTTFENHWQDVARLVLPRQDYFFNEQQQQGEQRTKYRTDDTAVMALERFAAAKESVRTPRGQRWHGIKVSDDTLENNHTVQKWTDSLTDFLFKKRYAPEANYASQQHECYMSDGAFGTSILAVEDMPGKGIRYKSCHVSEFFLEENAYGTIDNIYRRYKLTPNKAVELFGYNALPEKVRGAYDQKRLDEFEFLHVVIPNNGDVSNRFRYVSFDVSVDGKSILREPMGFKSLPYIIDRHLTAPNEVYGRSPAMSALAEIKMLNQMRKTDLRARHIAADPPFLAASQERVRGFFGKPGAINYGTLDDMGNQLVRPMQSGARIDLTDATIEQSRRMINDAFYVTLFQILVESPAMTATEVLHRAQEKGALISPVMNQAALGKLIEREIEIWEEYGIFEDGGILEMPDEVKDLGGNVEVVFTSPLAKMQKAEEAMSVERTIQALLPLAQIEPSILKQVDWMEYASIMREANGAPAKLLRSKEDMAAIMAQEAQQQAMAQMVQAAPQVAGAMKDVAQAQALAGE